MSVKNIKKHELVFGDIAAKLLQAYPFLRLDDADKKQISAYTPTHTRTLTYDVAGNTALANGWRRIMLDEIVWPRITCSMEDIKSDDAYCQRMTDYIQNRLWLIPTSWHDDDKCEFTLNVKNTTQQAIIVKSSDIKIKHAPGFIFAQEIDVIRLMPGRHISINMTLERGINRIHSSYSNFHGITYIPIDYDMDEKTLAKSYAVHPTNYRLGLTCEAFVDPVMAAVMGWTTMQNMLEKAIEKISVYMAAPVLPFISTSLTITTRSGVIRYEFIGETYTLSNLLAWYAYVIDKSITFIHAGDEHPEDNSTLVRIVHKDHANLLQQAARAAIKDVKSIISQLQ